MPPPLNCSSCSSRGSTIQQHMLLLLLRLAAYHTSFPRLVLALFIAVAKGVATTTAAAATRAGGPATQEAGGGGGQPSRRSSPGRPRCRRCRGGGQYHRGREHLSGERAHTASAAGCALACPSIATAPSAPPSTGAVSSGRAHTQVLSCGFRCCFHCCCRCCTLGRPPPPPPPLCTGMHRGDVGLQGLLSGH